MKVESNTNKKSKSKSKIMCLAQRFGWVLSFPEPQDPGASQPSRGSMLLLLIGYLAVWLGSRCHATADRRLGLSVANKASLTRQLGMVNGRGKRGEGSGIGDCTSRSAVQGFCMDKRARENGHSGVCNCVVSAERFDQWHAAQPLSGIYDGH